MHLNAMHMRTEMLRSRKDRVRRAPTACEACRVKKKRVKPANPRDAEMSLTSTQCALRSSDSGRQVCKECLSSNQVCVFSPKYLTSEVLSHRQRATLTDALTNIFLHARANGILNETAAQRESHPRPNVNYILDIINETVLDILNIESHEPVIDHEAVLEQASSPLGEQPSQEQLVENKYLPNYERYEWSLGEASASHGEPPSLEPSVSVHPNLPSVDDLQHNEPTTLGPARSEIDPSLSVDGLWHYHGDEPSASVDAHPDLDPSLSVDGIQQYHIEPASLSVDDLRDYDISMGITETIWAPHGHRLHPENPDDIFGIQGNYAQNDGNFGSLSSYPLPPDERWGNT